MIELLKNLKFFPLYIFSNYQWKPTRLYLIMPILGLFHLLKKRDAPKVFFIYGLVYLLPFMLSASVLDLRSMKRAVLSGVLILFLGFLLEKFSKKELIKLTKVTLIISGLFNFFELLTKQFSYKEMLSGFSDYTMFYMQGITGFSNHTGVLVASIFSIFLVQRNYKWMLASIPLAIFSGSRAGMLLIAFSLGLAFIQNFSWKLHRFVSLFVVFCCLASPLLALGLEKSLSDKSKLKISQLSHHRYALQLSFIELAKDYPLGVGVDKSQEYFNEYKNKGSSIVENNTYEIGTGHHKNTGAHNMFIKLLCENGFLPYLIFSFFILYVSKMGDPSYLTSFTSIMFGYLTLNGILEFPFYLIMAFMLKEVYEREEGLFKPFLSSLKVKERS